MPKKQEHLTTSIPAPFLPGFYSLQAVSASPETPDVTSYMRDLKSLSAFSERMVATGKFKGFLLRHSVDKWDVLGPKGKTVVNSVDARAAIRLEQLEPFGPSRATYRKEAAEVLGEGLSTLSCAEYHAAASAAEHSNMVVLLRVMLTDTKEDNPHIYISDTNRCGEGRVTSLVGHIAKMRTEESDRFLDRHNWVDRGWPLNNVHHAEILAGRLTLLRADYLADIITYAARADGMGDEGLPMVRFNVTAVSTEKRGMLTKDLIEILYSSIEYDDSGRAELFSLADVKDSAKRIMNAYNAAYGIAEPA